MGVCWYDQQLSRDQKKGRDKHPHPHPRPLAAKSSSSEARRATTHDLALTNELGVKFRAVESEVNVKVDAVKGALWCIHALKVLFEILPREVRCECDDFLDALYALVFV